MFDYQLFPKHSRFLLITSVLLLTCFSMFGRTGSPQPGYQLLHGQSFVASKNYYLLTLFSELKDVKAILAKDATLSGMGKTKLDSLRTALKNCGREGDCYISRMKFSEAEVKTVSERLSELYLPGNALEKLVQNHLIPSGTYIQFQTLAPKEMLVKAWEQDATAINYALDVYAGGKKPNYPQIDSIAFNTKTTGYLGLLYDAVTVVAQENKTENSFFQPSLTAALLFLEVNEREQAADYEPMAGGENKAAYDRIKTTDWKKYKYSLILVPGAGPDEPEVALSAEGMLRCRLAALQYKQGVAPFIVTSGGKVHPYKTKFCEALEMKQYLINKLGIPASAIIIEPHARHTTTNLRNTVRIMYRNGIPFSMPAITCTTLYQSTMIGTTLMARCQKELNEVPYKPGNRLSETEWEFYPLIEALQIDPDEPMDP
jgi:hypothetical protein